MVISYDENTIKSVLDKLPSTQQVWFACACAERLMPLYDLFASSAGMGDVHALRRGLDVAWDTSSTPIAAEAQRVVVEALVPHDDDADWSRWSAFAQNAAAAVAYSLRLVVSSDSQNGVWAARQLYEAADFVAQANGESPPNGGDNEAVVVALTAIADVLQAVRSSTPEALRSTAALDGSVLRQLAEQIN